MSSSDTIVARATASGRGGIGIVRVSGPRVPEIARAILGTLPRPRSAVFRAFRDATGEPLDDGIALYFAAPHSFTGEAVLELQGHGGPVVMDLLVAHIVGLGARLAHPGEFSQRAFLNDKLDLAQAEAVADLIDSGSGEAARAALRSLQGEFSVMVQGLTEAITDLRMYVEAAIDFPEEEVDFLADEELTGRLQAVSAHFDAVAAAARTGQLLRDGMTVVIAGAPNAGKSSLLNRLAGYEAAIVTEIPGTTRDVLRERIAIDGMPLHVIDTAGLRDVHDVVEGEGIRRARAEMTRADRILFVIDVAADPDAHSFAAERARLPAGVPVTLVLNKCDLTGDRPRLEAASAPPRIYLGALTGAGVGLLREHLKACVGFEPGEGGNVSARRRHLEALKRARAHLEAGSLQLRERRAGELLAEELRQAQIALGEITGEVTSDDLLGRIFASFCIGK
jgi:tRNA modification GTPase